MIRPARDDDAPALAALGHEVQALHLAARPDRYRDAPIEELAARYVALLADAALTILVAADGDAVVGYVVVKRNVSPAHTLAVARLTAHVDELGVRADARRGGHGRALMAEVEALARGWGAVAVTLDVQTFNPGAVAFYQALGYEPATLRLSRAL